jgi:hypothetical protein
VLRERLAAGRLRALGLRALRGRRLRGGLVRSVPAREQAAEDRERELGVARREPLGLLPREQPSLEALALLEQLQVELAIALALGGEPLVDGRELVDLIAERGEILGELSEVHARREAERLRLV